MSLISFDTDFQWWSLYSLGSLFLILVQHCFFTMIASFGLHSTGVFFICHFVQAFFMEAMPMRGPSPKGQQHHNSVTCEGFRYSSSSHSQFRVFPRSTTCTADKGDVGLSDVVLFNPQSDASLSRIWPDCCPLQETQTRYRIVPPPVKKGPTDERGTDIAPKEDPKRFARLRRRLLG